MVLVHGWTCDERTWQAQVPALAHDYRVITVNLPGHGRSGSPKDGKLSIDLFARAIEAVGFPVAVVLSWAFDLTPQGIKRTPSADSKALSGHGSPCTRLSQTPGSSIWNGGDSSLSNKVIAGSHP